MKLSLVLTFLCLSVLSASVRGSPACFLGCLMPSPPTDCDCNNYFGLFTDPETRRQAHHHHHTHHPDATSSLEPETTTAMPMRMMKSTTVIPKMITTTHICDTLCKIQLGGDACECSKPGLPGRK